LAVAYVGRKLAVPVTVVVPVTTTDRAKELLCLEGADVVVHGPSWQEANNHALSLVGSSDAFIHPFDDPLLWEGHATVIDEVVQSGLKPDAVVVSVGGGGLLCGVAEGLRRNGQQHVKIIAVETEGAASFHTAIKAGRLVQLDHITSIATSLGAKQVCERAFRWSIERSIQSVLISDQNALSACERFLADHRVLVEPACGASLALAYENSPSLKDSETVLVIACGGAAATIDQIRAWAKRDV
jgi:L-serine/L-threonine ammonia-lyase